MVAGPGLVLDTVNDALEHCVRHPKVKHELPVEPDVQRLLLKSPKQFSPRAPLIVLSGVRGVFGLDFVCRLVVPTPPGDWVPGARNDIKLFLGY